MTFVAWQLQDWFSCHFHKLKPFLCSFFFSSLCFSLCASASSVCARCAMEALFLFFWCWLVHVYKGKTSNGLKTVSKSHGHETLVSYWPQTLQFLPQPSGYFTVVSVWGAHQQTLVDGAYERMIRRRALNNLYMHFLRGDMEYGEKILQQTANSEETLPQSVSLVNQWMISEWMTAWQSAVSDTAHLCNVLQMMRTHYASCDWRNSRTSGSGTTALKRTSVGKQSVDMCCSSQTTVATVWV